MVDLRIKLDTGKYEVVFPEDGKLHALRYGEPWRDLTGDKLILAMMYEIERLRDQIGTLQVNLKWCCDAFEDAVRMIGMDEDDKEGIEICRSLLPGANK